MAEIEVENELIDLPDLLPAWRESVVTLSRATPALTVPSHRGVDSLCWSVSFDGAAPTQFLKIVHPEQARFLNIVDAFSAQRQAASLGCTPKVIFADPARRAVVTDLLDGWRTARIADLRNPDVLERVLIRKMTIHSSTAFNGSWSVFDRLRMLETERRAAGAEAPDDLGRMIGAVNDIENAILAAGWNQRPAHADGLASNVMIGPRGEIQLVDFDEARNIDPYYELGILLNEVFQSEEEMLPALEMFDGSIRQSSLNRARLYAIADDLAWGLWGLVMDVTSRRRRIEFLQYAYWRLLRCRVALNHPDFERRLRQL
ncbi:phosphotransferase [Mesorhizobium sp.]|uniref:phosphotransferase family protein n=1 Tax=Mesorhizobium sp. TaxID=1871066 RepID=UPI000FE4621F|nr:phosphotransferase [Mesorhizobium sp.]RWI16455.1 MAG: phosphotransferase [Mesorhizobium sp.]RWN08483.1 MAG: phosphotransferase [Mesorhizobium sp.]RWN08699.1 MAG: phosphotransferase [Mesorhizobium sp.]TIQ97573.1 MAG: phosphotransferase [Mesorhizobium sp.]